MSTYYKGAVRKARWGKKGWAAMVTQPGVEAGVGLVEVVQFQYFKTQAEAYKWAYCKVSFLRAIRNGSPH